MIATCRLLVCCLVGRSIQVAPCKTRLLKKYREYKKKFKIPFYLGCSKFTYSSCLDEIIECIMINLFIKSLKTITLKFLPHFNLFSPIKWKLKKCFCLVKSKRKSNTSLYQNEIDYINTKLVLYFLFIVPLIFNYSIFIPITTYVIFTIDKNSYVE